MQQRQLKPPLLCLVTDMDRPDLLPAVEIALSTGVDMLQLRGHHLTAARMYTQAQALRSLCRQYNCLLIVNDRIDVGLAVGADGLQIGANSLPLPVVRQLVGANYLLGVSVHTVEEAQAAIGGGADFLLAGTIFPSRSHPERPGCGPGLLSEIKQKIDPRQASPLLAIGGITSANTQQVIAAGADGVAVISSLLQAPDIAQAARELRSAMYIAYATRKLDNSSSKKENQ
jgi:thiamine-phosphate pyrophosphorylase